MRQNKTEQIGQYRYTIAQLGARQGMLVYRRLASLLGNAAEGLDGAGEGAALRAIGKLVQGLSDEDLSYFVDTFAPMTSVSGGEFTKGSPQLDGIFEEHFAGKMLAMTQWLIACFRTNFSDLFEVLGKSDAPEDGKVAAAETASSSTSPTPASVIGMFGGSSQAKSARSA